MIRQSFLILMAIISVACNTPPKVVPGHAHNDYENDNPLMDALTNGFMSVEVDIHLIEEELYVAHDRPQKLDSNQTLEMLYLKPLLSIVRKNNGSVYPNYSGPFYLMLDVKTSASSTYQKLEIILSEYSSMINQSGPVKILVSGNRPVDQILDDENALMGLDGRLINIDQNITSSIMPIVSDNYQNHFSWDGRSEISDSQRSKMRALAQLVHDDGKLLRLWAAPDHPTAWRVLLDNGIDIINTDRLQEFSEFMSDYKSK